MTDKQQRLFTQVNNAVLAHLQFISVAILGARSTRDVNLGSGTCITIEGRFFVATAAHVIEPYTNDQIMLLLTHDRQDWAPTIIGRGLDAMRDVAWLEISADVIPHSDRRFITHTRLLPSCAHVEDDVVAVHGFPKDLANPTVNHEIGVSVQPLCFGTGTIQPALLGGDPAQDLFLEYPDDDLTAHDGRPTRGIEAPGISGGGIWMVNVNKRGVWSVEDCRLIGIEHSWLRWKWLRGTQIQHWIDLLARDVPELQSVLESPRPC